MANEIIEVERAQDPNCPSCGANELFYRTDEDETLNRASCMSCDWRGLPALLPTHQYLHATPNLIILDEMMGEHKTLEAWLSEAGQVGIHINEEGNSKAGIALTYEGAFKLWERLGEILAHVDYTPQKGNSVLDTLEAGARVKMLEETIEEVKSIIDGSSNLLPGVFPLDGDKLSAIESILR